MNDSAYLCVVALKVLGLFVELDVDDSLLEVKGVTHLVE
jgi:hypothetical protein